MNKILVFTLLTTTLVGLTSGRSLDEVARQSSDPTCVENAINFLTLLKDKVGNFNKQKARIEKFTGIAEKKSAKKEIFTEVYGRVVSAGGGDAANLMCGADKDSDDTKTMKALAKDLSECSKSIESECETSKPEIDMASLDDCAKKMTAFDEAVSKCTAKDNADTCGCLNAADIKAASEAIKEKACSISDLTTKVKDFKLKCTKAFSTCKGKEDEANGVLAKCKPDKDALLKNLKNVDKNEKALNSLKEAADSIKTSDSRQASTCSKFAEALGNILNLVTGNPADTTVPMKSEEAVKSKPATCTADEIKTIKALKIEIVINVVKKLVEKLQEKLKAETGTTASSETINETTAAGATTAAATTAAGATTAAATTASGATTAAATTAAGATTAAATTAAGATTAAATTAAGATTAAATTAAGATTAAATTASGATTAAATTAAGATTAAATTAAATTAAGATTAAATTAAGATTAAATTAAGATTAAATTAAGATTAAATTAAGSG